VALAGLGWPPDTLLSRSIVIGMRRRAPTETIEPYRRRDEIEEGHKLRGRLAGWVARKARALYAARPVMPAGIEDRNADVWEARLRIPPPRDLLRRLLDIGFGGNVACRSLEVISLLGFSAAYNMWPVSPAKWVLRRFDHSAIYLLIAGTYTPFLMQMKNVLASASLGIGVWLTAVVGMALKLVLPGRFDRLAVGLCLLLGWSGVVAYDSLASVLPSSSLWLIAIGGILYSLGTLFHLLQRLRFHNAIWHGFVLLAASCHYVAVLACLLSA
jgi:hemolysin III